MREISENIWHGIDAREAAAALDTHETDGLSEQAVNDRAAAFGPNELTRKKGQGPVTRFLLQLWQPLVIILVVSAGITFFLEEYVDAAVIGAVVLVNAVVGFVQESKAIRAIEALARAMTSEAVVIRGGVKQHIDARRLVPGDVVLLQSGDKVPADLRLVFTRELQIDESALTGESVPVQKEPGRLAPDLVLGDRRNMAYASTLVTYGSGRGLVVATGNRTEIGRIQQLIETADVLETPLTKKMRRFSSGLLWVILAMSALTFAVGFLRGQDLVEMFMASVALAVGAVPEGLPAAITITLAIGVSRMARRNAIIRRLPAVETLGSTMVICSDKTGTLTQNQMTVVEIVAGGPRYEVSGAGYAPEGAITPMGGPTDPSDNVVLAELLKAGLLCNDSALKRTESGWQVEGDPTEGALIAAAMKAGMDPRRAEKDMPRVDTIPFESARQYMATLHDPGNGRPCVLYVKGSVESVCFECGKTVGPADGSFFPDPDAVSQWVESMTDRGLRVLAFARREMPPGTTRITHADVAAGVEFLGLQGMIDPPRPEAVAAVAACKAAGIGVKMITGDHAGTAAAIARQIGLCESGGVCPAREVLTGREIAEMDDEKLAAAADSTAVFARVSPEQKLRLVKALQKGSRVVAMTGDGVNDAPALRQADIGVAMGMAGTEVSREAADMVLTDDNFATIEAAVEEGRAVFDNLVKFIVWALPTNGGMGLIIMASVLTGIVLPILPLQILWINMTTAGVLGLTLAFEPREPGIMGRPPRHPDMPVLTRPLILRIFFVSLLLVIGAFGLFGMEMMLSDGNEALARTLAVNVFVFGELFFLFNCRSTTHPPWAPGFWSNPFLWAGIALMSLLQVVYTYVPAFNKIFKSAPMGATEWGLVLAAGLAIFVLVEIEKWVRRRSGHRP